MSKNYFSSASGRIVTQWPYGNEQYRLLTKVLGRISEVTYRRRGGGRLNHRPSRPRNQSWMLRLHCLVTAASGAMTLKPWHAPG